MLTCLLACLRPPKGKTVAATWLGSRSLCLCVCAVTRGMRWGLWTCSYSHGGQPRRAPHQRRGRDSLGHASTQKYEAGTNSPASHTPAHSPLPHHRAVRAGARPAATYGAINTKGEALPSLRCHARPQRKSSGREKKQNASCF